MHEDVEVVSPAWGKPPHVSGEGTITVRLVGSAARAQVPVGTTVAEALRSLGVEDGEGEGRLVGAEAQGQVLELMRPLWEDTQLRPLTFQDPRGQRILRHTAAHMLAQAVKRLYPQAKLGTGPATEDGFYYDIQFPHPVGPEVLGPLEREMQAIAQAAYPLLRQAVGREEALELFTQRQEPFKVELIRELPPATQLTVYRQGEFVDLCRGPHVPHTGYVGAVALTNLAGAYWRGEEGRPMLTRVYGTAFPTAQGLERYRQRVEEARQRDHRRLGRELELFTFLEEAPGIPFWLPKGVTLLRILESLMRRLQEAEGYQEVRTPQLLSADLWKRSGHWDHYRENMFVAATQDGEMAIKPMNCPGAVLLYRQGLHSYRDLPLRLMDFGSVHRNERSGTLHGLLRTRNFVQDDAHIFLTPDQIQEEVRRVLELVDRVYRIFGLRYFLELSTRPANAMGDIELWHQAETSLQAALESVGVPYATNPGEGAFYGPKVDVHVEDSLGRRWQCGTVQLDFQLPQRFELEYVGPDGERHRPVMIHRAILGSLERFAGVLIEHFAGAFPLWLSPVQVRVLPVTQRQEEMARQLAVYLRQEGTRVEVQGAQETLGRRIRQAQLDRVPLVAVVGEREASSRTVSIRARGQTDSQTFSWEELAKHVRQLSFVDGVGWLW
jgi:threonyl-tRNA synthetase